MQKMNDDAAMKHYNVDGKLISTNEPHDFVILPILKSSDLWVTDVKVTTNAEVTFYTRSSYTYLNIQ